MTSTGDPGPPARAGRITLEVGGEAWDLPLAAESIVGRWSGCTHRIRHDAIPALWLELRWFSDLSRPSATGGWGLRVLADPDETTVPQSSSSGLPAGWHLVPAGRRAIQHKHAQVRILLNSDGPPQPFARDLVSGELLDGEAFDRCFEVIEGRVHLAGWEDRPEPGGSAVDGGVLVDGHCAWLLHLGLPPRGTLRPRGDLRSPGCRLHLRALPAEDWEASLSWPGGATDVVQGVRARLLHAYAENRTRQAAIQGYLHQDEVLLAVFGDVPGAGPGPRPHLLHELHRDVRKWLLSQDVTGVTELFEPDRDRPRPWPYRLCLPPSAIEIDTAEEPE